MDILVTNDDGIDAFGISLLLEILDELKDSQELNIKNIYCVAPNDNRSGASQSITIKRPLSLKQVSESSWSINGTPADCVLFGLGNILKRKPSLVLSGINDCLNVGQDINYSGTVGSAIEGAMLGVPSVAFSMSKLLAQEDKQITIIKSIIKNILLKLNIDELGTKSILNFNLPNILQYGFKGYKQASIGFRHYDSCYIENTDPRGNKYFWLGAGGDTYSDIEGSDIKLVHQGFVTYTYVSVNRGIDGNSNSVLKEL